MANILSQMVDVPPAGTVSCVTHDKTMMLQVHSHQVARKDTGEGRPQCRVQSDRVQGPTEEWH